MARPALGRGSRAGRFRGRPPEADGRRWSTSCIELLREDAAELGCLPELERAREIVAAEPAPTGSWRSTAGSIEGGGSAAEGHRAVVDWLVERTLAGMPR